MELPSPIPRKRARIEVIPLIDIVFFLLATFVMVSLSMVKHRGISVDLPEVDTATTTAAPDDSDVTLTIRQDGQIYWNKNAVSIESLAGQLSSLRETSPEARVIINGDAEAKLGEALSLLDLARTSGLRKVQFQTKPVSDPVE